MKRAKKNSLRGRIAAGVHGFAGSVNAMAMALAGTSGGYEGGSRDNRRSRSWRPAAGGPVADLLPDVPDLRSRSRDLERNAPLALGAINTKVNGVIGTGLVLKSQVDFQVLGLDRDTAIAAQAAIEREFELWALDADYCGQLHFSDLQRLAYRSARVSGDVGIARRYRKEPGKIYGTRLVAIEADRISNPRNAADTATVRGGVQVSADGVIEGYYVSDRHPGEMVGTALTWQFVPRVGPDSGLKQFLLPYQVERPGQPRGIPLFAPIVELIKTAGDYTKAEVDAAVHDAMMFAVETLAKDDDSDHVVEAPGGATNDDELQLEDMAIITLGEGSSVMVRDPKRPNTGYGPFLEMIIKQIGVALGIPFELMLMNFGASFSASRGALEIAWKGFLAEKAWFEREVLDQVYEWVLTEAVALGRLKLPGFLDDPLKRRAWMGRQWVGPTRIQINPQVEANADKTDLEMGVKTRDQIITERTGGDFDRKNAQTAYEKREREKAGLGGGGTSPLTSDPPPPDDAGDDEQDDEPDDGNDKEDRAKNA